MAFGRPRTHWLENALVPLEKLEEVVWERGVWVCPFRFLPLQPGIKYVAENRWKIVIVFNKISFPISSNKVCCCAVLKY